MVRINAPRAKASDMMVDDSRHKLTNARLWGPYASLEAVKNAIEEPREGQSIVFQDNETSLFYVVERGTTPHPLGLRPRPRQSIEVNGRRGVVIETHTGPWRPFSFAKRVGETEQQFSLMQLNPTPLPQGAPVPEPPDPRHGVAKKRWRRYQQVIQARFGDDAKVVDTNTNGRLEPTDTLVRTVEGVTTRKAVGDALYRSIRVQAAVVHACERMADLHQFSLSREAKFATEFWEPTSSADFKLKAGVRPSEAIQDILDHPDRYTFECSTAVEIAYCIAALELTLTELLSTSSSAP